MLLEVCLTCYTALLFQLTGNKECVPTAAFCVGKDFCSFQGVSAGPSGCCEIIVLALLWMQACFVVKTQGCSFSYGTIVTSLVTVSLQFSCQYKCLITATETLLALKQNWMLFGLLHTRKPWSLPILLSVSHFSIPSKNLSVKCLPLLLCHL